ncbi:MAG: biotin--[acetyl-CoA-carboxylase] ligase [Methanomicrobiales archaeon]|jgi:BirA family biotin operon repressor/biotin-[acetyl-CoA-carboxylase] ligase|nr:biotin--[acetyl-CoA-carboxylase] ligase [Methanomicrobiales archaeon]
MNTTANQILSILEKGGTPISREEISTKIGVPEAEIKDSIKELRELGYEIEESKEAGYRLVQRTDRLLPYEVKRHLRTDFIGQRIEYYPSISSTTMVAKELLVKTSVSELNGIMIIAEEQSGGFGRLDRPWFSPHGGIWTTILLKPKMPVDRVFMLTMASSIAIVRAIRKLYRIGALIKWPNDIYIGDQKVAGILLEISAEGGEVEHCILGIGVDANIPQEALPKNLNTPVTSLMIEHGEPIDRAAFLAHLLREFERRYQQIEMGEYDSIVREWKSLSLTLDKRVKIKTPRLSFEGTAIDIDEYGALIVRRDNGKTERVFSGDCTPV